MANNKVIFDSDAGVAFPVNLTLNTGANFNATFEVVNTSNTGYNFSTTNSLGVNTTSGCSGSSQMRKSISIGSGTTADATFQLVSILLLLLVMDLQFHWGQLIQEV